jgi:hypothetical protein
LEEAVYEECTKEHVVCALLRVDLDMTDKTAQQVGGLGLRWAQHLGRAHSTWAF